MATKLIVMLGFVVAFAAGMAVGVRDHALIVPASTTSTPTTHPNRAGWLVAELDLTPDQQEKLNDIWSKTARSGNRGQEDIRRQFRKERDDAIAALIPSQNQPAYEQAVKTYSDHMEQLEQQWRSAYENAVEQTKQILTPSQRSKYEEILSRNQWDRRAGDRATTRPTSPQ
jgi:Spy/CpxP family protein refolding chaperone